MNEVAKHEPRQEVATYSDGLLSVIERAARDPSVDIDKMERLIEMQERIHTRNAKIAYAEELAALQPKLPIITERGKIIVREKTSSGKRDGVIQQATSYALWEDINETIRPLLADHGFSLSFRTGLAEDGRITVTGVLSHCQGHSEETTMILPHDSSGSKNPVQAIGSSTSYGKRYTAMALLNITTKGEDDDGQAGGASHAISVKEYNGLLKKMAEVEADTGRFTQYLRSAGKLPTDDLSDLPSQHLPFALDALNQKTGKAQQ